MVFRDLTQILKQDSVIKKYKNDVKKLNIENLLEKKKTANNVNAINELQLIMSELTTHLDIKMEPSEDILQIIEKNRYILYDKKNQLDSLDRIHKQNLTKCN